MGQSTISAGLLNDSSKIAKRGKFTLYTRGHKDHVRKAMTAKVKSNSAGIPSVCDISQDFVSADKFDVKENLWSAKVIA